MTVHYVTNFGAHVPAIVCYKDDNGVCTLYVFDTTRRTTYFAENVSENNDEEKPDNTWHVPESEA